MNEGDFKRESGIMKNWQLLAIFIISLSLLQGCSVSIDDNKFEGNWWLSAEKSSDNKLSIYSSKDISPIAIEFKTNNVYIESSKWGGVELSLSGSWIANTEKKIIVMSNNYSALDFVSYSRYSFDIYKLKLMSTNSNDNFYKEFTRE